MKVITLKEFKNLTVPFIFSIPTGNHNEYDGIYECIEIIFREGESIDFFYKMYTNNFHTEIVDGGYKNNLDEIDNWAFLFFDPDDKFAIWDRDDIKGVVDKLDKFVD